MTGWSEPGGWYAWSARPDLWGPGTCVRWGDPHSRAQFSNWVDVPWDAQVEVLQSRTAGMSAPGVAEAAQLSGGLRVDLDHVVQGWPWEPWSAFKDVPLVKRRGV